MSHDGTPPRCRRARSTPTAIPHFRPRRAQLAEHQRWRRHLNNGRGYQGCGWIFDAETVFDTIGLLEWVRLAPVGRVKGVMRIAEGAVRINRQGRISISRPSASLRPIAGSSLFPRMKPTGTHSRPRC